MWVMNYYLFNKKIEIFFKLIKIGIQPRMPRQPTISQEQKNKSQEFITALNSLLGLIDDISTYIPEGKYIEMMNQLKTVNDTVENPIINIVRALNNTEVVEENRRRIEMPIRILKKDRKGQLCPYCDTPVCNLKAHQQRTKCKLIRRTKYLSARSGNWETNFEERKMNNFEIICEKMDWIHLLRDWINNMD